MKRIAIDMDEVIADTFPKFLRQFNQTYNQSVTVQDTQGKWLTDLYPDLKKDILKLYDEPTFFRDIDVIQDCQEVIEELSHHYEIFITTAAMEFPTSFTAKYEWLKEHFSFLNEMNVVFCGDKSILYSDYLIDDSPGHFDRFVGKGLLFTAPHNVNEKRYMRVNNWDEIRHFFLKK